MALSLSGERPRTAAASANPLRTVARWLQQARAAQRRRKALTALLALDHCRLNDLGIERQDVLEAMRVHGASAGQHLAAVRATKARL